MISGKLTVIFAIVFAVVMGSGGALQYFEHVQNDIASDITLWYWVILGVVAGLAAALTSFAVHEWD